MRRFAVVGNREEGWTYPEIKAKLQKIIILRDDIIISGGAIGVDTYAEQYADELDHKKIIHKPDKNLPIPERFFARNRKIVEDADIILAFNKKHHGGTTQTINYAKKLKKKVLIFTGSPTTTNITDHGPTTNPTK